MTDIFRVWDPEDKEYKDGPNALDEDGYIEDKIGKERTWTAEFYIGAEDDKGKSIYVGDIVYHPTFGYCVVKWNGNTLSYTFKSVRSGLEASYQDVKNSLEVVGNVHNE